MKKITLLTGLICLISQICFAQYWNNDGNPSATSPPSLPFLGTTDGITPLKMYVYDVTAPGVPAPLLTLEQTNNVLCGLNNLYTTSGGGLLSSHAYGNNNTFGIASTPLENAFMFGNNNSILSNNAFALGNENANWYSTDVYSFLIGNNNVTEGGDHSFALGNYLTLANPNTFAIGSGQSGNNLTNNISKSLMVGFNSQANFFVGPQYNSTTTGVGINTIMPASMFHCVGDASIGTYSTGLYSYSGILNVNTAGVTGGRGIVIERNEGSWGYFKARIDVSSGTNGKVGLRFLTTADAFYSTEYEAMHLAEDGTVGFGTTWPVSKVHVNGILTIGEYSLPSAVYGGMLNINTKDHPDGIVIERNDGAWSAYKAKIGIAGTGSHPGLRFIMSEHAFDQSGADGEPASGYDALYLSGNGNVGIHTTDPTNALDVIGTIRGTKVLVQALPWPDYVFKTDYKLASLDEVETYIKANSHLPEIPSENEIFEKGLNLGEMQALHMKKIEELTLYVIELKKEVDALKKQVNQQ
jgi:hypothetical protein